MSALSLLTVGNRKSIAIGKGEKAIIISLQVSSICEGRKGRGRVRLFPRSLMKDTAFRQPLDDSLKIRTLKTGRFFLVGDGFTEELFCESGEIWQSAVVLFSLSHLYGWSELKGLVWRYYIITHDFKVKTSLLPGSYFRDWPNMRSNGQMGLNVPP